MTGQDEERRRIRELSRQTWLELAFDEPPADVPVAVATMWAGGGTSTKVACRVLDTDLRGLLQIAHEHGIPVTRELTESERWECVAEVVRLGEEIVEDALRSWQAGTMSLEDAAAVTGFRDAAGLRWLCERYGVEVVKEDDE